MGTDLLHEATEYANTYQLNVNEIYAWSENHKRALERIQAPILIRGISEIFYQSFFCPEHSTYDTTESNITTADVQNFVKSGWVNTKCKCDAGYTAWNGACLLSCADDQYRDTTTGVCTSCTTGYTVSGGTAITEHNGCELADDEVQQVPSQFIALDATP